MATQGGNAIAMVPSVKGLKVNEVMVIYQMLRLPPEEAAGYTRRETPDVFAHSSAPLARHGRVSLLCGIPKHMEASQ